MATEISTRCDRGREGQTAAARAAAPERLTQVLRPGKPVTAFARAIPQALSQAWPWAGR